MALAMLMIDGYKGYLSVLARARVSKLGVAADPAQTIRMMNVIGSYRYSPNASQCLSRQ